MSPSLAQRWLARDPAALALLPADVQDRALRADAVKAAASRNVHPLVLDALRAHAATLPDDPSVAAGIAALHAGGVATVVTGQQMGLFGGPLFTLYKAAGAIRLARLLEEETGVRCVPVFWLQAEDHDLVEINTAAVPGERGALCTFQLDAPGAEANRVPVAHLPLGGSEARVLDELASALQGMPAAHDVMGLLRRAYTPGKTWLQAFAHMMAEVFHGQGLVQLHPRMGPYAVAAAGIHARMLRDAGPIASLLQQRSQALRDAGLEPQVHIRPGAPLFFHAPGDAHGARHRVVPDGGGGWQHVGAEQGASMTTEALLDDLERQPLRFSASALQRPILQDALLPNAAYVGGPGELAYLAQVVPLYAHLGMRMPMVVHRPRFRVVDDRTSSLLGKLGFTADEACGPRDELVARLSTRALNAGAPAPDAVGGAVLDAFLQQLEAMKRGMVSVDAAMEREAARVEATVRDSVGRMVGRYRRALEERSRVDVERLDRVRGVLLPGGEPQERVLGWPWLAARLGTRAMVDLVLGSTDPLVPSLVDLSR